MDSKLHILQHALGVNEFGEGPQFRNSFVTGPGGTDHELCLELTQGGLMVNRGSSELTGGSDCFVVTRQGISHMSANSPARPPEPKLTRSQASYRSYRQSESSSSFSEWMGFDRPRG